MPALGRVGVDSAGGSITGPGATSVAVNGVPVSLIGDAVASHGLPPHTSAVMVGGSSTVFAEGIGVCRFGDAASCGHTLSPGSSNVSAG